MSDASGAILLRSRYVMQSAGHCCTDIRADFSDDKNKTVVRNKNVNVNICAFRFCRLKQNDCLCASDGLTGFTNGSLLMLRDIIKIVL